MKKYVYINYNTATPSSRLCDFMMVGSCPSHFAVCFAIRVEVPQGTNLKKGKVRAVFTDLKTELKYLNPVVMVMKEKTMVPSKVLTDMWLNGKDTIGRVWDKAMEKQEIEDMYGVQAMRRKKYKSKTHYLYISHCQPNPTDRICDFNMYDRLVRDCYRAVRLEIPEGVKIHTAVSEEDGRYHYVDDTRELKAFNPTVVMFQLRDIEQELDHETFMWKAGYNRISGEDLPIVHRH